MTETDPLHDAIGRDYLGFGLNAEFYPGRVLEFLELGAGDNFRFIDRDHLEEIAKACNLVAEAFGGDIEKTAKWFRASNPMLGDMSPLEMIRLGRLDRLRKFIDDAREAFIGRGLKAG
jgi:hypothetical protein